ncbi:MAG: dihydroneopterin triphosphate diphosphatase [Gammaproteobacteria bacterium]|nr:dihydroneopterin triphosphate diphosphatase [Gammaproteobacteria bacterium]NNC68549.1 dihydroneopterin triphosphate diphosphatase [Gammaproteobacteria bacterium]
MEYKRPESVLVLVYTQAGEVLMLRRKYPSDFWQSVTGSLEWDENPQQAAIRELQEETGISEQELHDCQYSQNFEIYSIWRDRYAPGVTENQEHVFSLELTDKVDIQLDPREHEEYIWLSKQKALELAFSHTNQDAIQRWVP